MRDKIDVFEPTTRNTLIPTPFIEYEYVWMNHGLFYTIAAIAVIEVLVCLICLYVINKFLKKHLTFINAGMRLIYVFVAGCVMMLLSVPLFGIDSKVTTILSIPTICTIRVWLLSVGFTLSVGVMVVRVIYTTIPKLDTSQKFVFRTSIILYWLFALVIADTLIVVAWKYFSPPRKEFAVKETDQVGLRDERMTLVESCNSEKQSVVIAVLCFCKGLPLLVAFLLSIFWRGEEEMRNQDFKQCRVGLLSALITSFVALPIVLSLPFHPNVSFAIGGLLVVAEVGFLMCWIIIVKMIKAWLCNKGEAKEFGKYAVAGQTRIPCTRYLYGCVNLGFGHSQFYDESFYESEVGFSLNFLSGSITQSEPVSEDHSEEYGFDCKEMDIYTLPSDLPNEEDFNLDEYDPNCEQAEEEEEVEIVEKSDSSSDESSDESDAEKDEREKEQQEEDEEGKAKEEDNESRAIGFSACTLERSAASVRNEVPPLTANTPPAAAAASSSQQLPPPTPETASGGRADTPPKEKKWWTPLFGAAGLFRPKSRKRRKSVEQEGQTSAAETSDEEDGSEYTSTEDGSSSETDSD